MAIQKFTGLFNNRAPSSSSPPSPIIRLPNDILNEIFKHLIPSSVSTLALVCKEWNSLFKENGYVWQLAYQIYQLPIPMGVDKSSISFKEKWILIHQYPLDKRHIVCIKGYESYQTITKKIDNALQASQYTIIEYSPNEGDTIQPFNKSFFELIYRDKDGWAGKKVVSFHDLKEKERDLLSQGFKRSQQQGFFAKKLGDIKKRLF